MIKLEKLDKPFTVQRGVRKEDPLSRKLTNISFADDIVIFANTTEQLQQLLVVSINYSKLVVLDINYTKTKIMSNN